ncbi:hypothetical protein [Actinomadura kijaniata]|uniref:hypothetical protein n=1 Tax=Actinomadura kijaniata TaxID=46161 RepID=UPI00082BF065|nr:hypothetical protein [Actinomadura kijaniata]
MRPAACQSTSIGTARRARSPHGSSHNTATSSAAASCRPHAVTASPPVSAVATIRHPVDATATGGSVSQGSSARSTAAHHSRTDPATPAPRTARPL